MDKTIESGSFSGLGKAMAIVPEYKETAVIFSVDSEGFKSYVTSEYTNLSAVQGAMVPPRKNLELYLALLLKFRVLWTLGVRLPFHPKGTKFNIPAFFYDLLCSVGKVQADEFGLILKPEFTWQWQRDIGTKEQPQLKVMSLDEMFEEALRLSRQFKPFFEAARISCATELPVERLGNINFMALQIVENHVMAESTATPPVFAIMCAILNSVQATTVCMPRVSYGSLQYLRNIILKVGDYECRK